jgi:hypothetical protein
MTVSQDISCKRYSLSWRVERRNKWEFWNINTGFGTYNFCLSRSKTSIWDAKFSYKHKSYLAVKNGEHTELEVSHLKYLEPIIKSHGEIKLSTIGSKLGGWRLNKSSVDLVLHNRWWITSFTRHGRVGNWVIVEKIGVESCIKCSGMCGEAFSLMWFYESMMDN